jgi:hypothetical protein
MAQHTQNIFVSCSHESASLHLPTVIIYLTEKYCKAVLGQCHGLSNKKRWKKHLWALLNGPYPDFGLVPPVVCAKKRAAPNCEYAFYRKQRRIRTLIKKKIKFSSYIKKFRVEQLQSHI